MAEGEDPQLPANVRRLQPSFDRNIWGRFHVCAQTPDKPGWMRMVTVVEAKDLYVIFTR